MSDITGTTGTTGTLEVDVVVVGGGSAGCVLAARLSEDPDRRVALLEVGGPEAGEDVTVPARAWLLPAGDLVRPAPTVPQEAVGGRVVPLVTGRVLGGGSSVNAMLWFQGHPQDYDGWAAGGAAGWDAAAMRSAFARVEDHELGAAGGHGSLGPMPVTGPRHLHPLALPFLRAGVEQGWALSEDLSGTRRTGVALTSSNIRDGRRHSVVDGYLSPVSHRPNLTLLTGARASAVVVDRDRAVGVRVRSADGSTLEVSARDGVVLSAGALGTPQLLMLSGIGPAAHLGENGLPVVRDLPAVGEHLQDHLSVPVPFLVDDAVVLPADPEGDYRLARRGPLSSLGQVVAAVRAGEAPADAPPELVLALGLTGAQAGLPSADGPGGAWAVGLLEPDSRGTVRLAPDDPAGDLVVDPRYLTAPRDRPRLREGVRAAFRLLAADSVRGLVTPAVPVPEDDAALDSFVDSVLGTFYHPVGTARMGTGADTVVDPRLRVHGVGGLWVADASVMPRITRALPHASTIAIAERAAQLIISELAGAA